jgi:hypothetical protein
MAAKWLLAKWLLHEGRLPVLWDSHRSVRFSNPQRLQRRMPEAVT